MAAKKKNTTKKTENSPVEEIKEEIIQTEEAPAEPVVEETPVVEEKVEEKPKEVEEKPKKEKKAAFKPRFSVGDLVYVSKNAEADLNGFSLFSQYKKDPYTVEAYDADRGIYLLRRQKLLIRLKEDLILAPSENAHDSINRRQF